MVTWLLSYNAFSVASFILYGDTYTIPLASTFIIAVILFGGVYTSKYWVKAAESALVWLAGLFKSEHDMLGDDGDDD
jgi:hypothetical protein